MTAEFSRKPVFGDVNNITKNGFIFNWSIHLHSNSTDTPSVINHAYWQALKMGMQPSDPGVPFVFKKFRALLSGAGLNARDLGNGNLRLGPMTDKALAELQPIALRNAGIIDPKTMEPIAGGLFDSALVQGNKWAKIDLPVRIPNPAFEDSIRKLLGLTRKQFEAVMSGKEELPEHLLPGLEKRAAVGQEE